MHWLQQPSSRWIAYGIRDLGYFLTWTCPESLNEFRLVCCDSPVYTNVAQIRHATHVFFLKPVGISCRAVLARKVFMDGANNDQCNY